MTDAIFRSFIGQLLTHGGEFAHDAAADDDDEGRGRNIGIDGNSHN